jgi:transcriptional regulator with XRE-family HTH domain
MSDKKKTMKANIGEKIKTFREMRNYSQQYMAEKLGISQPDYSNIEKGAVTLGVDRLFSIAQILGVTVNTILDFDDSKVFNIYGNTTEKGVISKVVFQDGISSVEKALYDKLLAEKDKRIAQLEREMERVSPPKNTTKRK